MGLRNATLIYAFGKYSKVIIQFLVTIVLARLLTPYDYGIVAIISVFSSLFSSFSDMGFGVAIVQKRWLTKKQIEDIFSFTLYFSFMLALVFGFLSYFIAKFYNDRVYISLGWMLSLSLFFNALNMVPNGLMNKHELFKQIALRTVISYTISAIMAIIFAYLGFRYYALVLQSILAAIITFFWNYSNLKLKFRFRFNMNSIKVVSSYSGYQFAFNIVNYLSENLDSLLTGKFFGSKALGYYNKAFNLTLYPVDNLVGVNTPVLHPILSKYQKNKNVIYTKYLRVFKILFLISSYVSVFCFFASSEIIILVYGNQWKAAIPCFHVLSLVIFTRTLNASCAAIFQVLNNTRLLFYNGALNTVITVIAILIGVFLGGNIYYLSLCIAISYIIQFITAFYMLIRLAFNFSFLRFVKDIHKLLIMFVLLIISTLIFNFNMPSNILTLMAKFVYISIVFVILVFLTGQFNIITSMLKNRE